MSSRAPPHPRELHRRLHGQALIDALFQISGPLTRPVTSHVERAWLAGLARPGLSRAAGRFADLRLPRPVLGRLIDAFVRLYDIDTTEIAEPLPSFATLNAFFTRALRGGMRPIDPRPEVLVSPADACLKSVGTVDPRGRIPEVKGRT